MMSSRTWTAYLPGRLRLADKPGCSPLVKRQRVCAAEVWCEALGKNRGDMRKRDAREINQLLSVMPGWAYSGLAKAGKPYGPQRCYDRIAVTF